MDNNSKTESGTEDAVSVDVQRLVRQDFHCLKCGSKMKKKLVLCPSYNLSPDFHGDTGREDECTVCEGSGKFATGLVCKKCYRTVVNKPRL